MAMFPCLFCGAPDQPDRLVCPECDRFVDRYGHENALYQAFCYGAMLAARSAGLTGSFARDLADQADKRRRETGAFLSLMEKISQPDP